MPSYRYIALNQQDVELTGVIEADAELGARSKLNELGLSVVALNQDQSAAAPSAQAVTFEFEAFDQNKKKVIGTIKADAPVKAFARLTEEYQLAVLSLVASDLKPEEKEAQKNAGAATIQREYEVLYLKNRKKEEAVAAQTSQAFERERKELFDKVDYTTRRVETFLKLYGAELKPEEKDVIRGYINQLIRIKDSTNLEHIRSTCERMLTHLQTQEVFINEENRLKESSKLKVDTREMLKQLKSSGLQQDISFNDLANKAVGQWKGNAVLKPIAEFLLKIFPPPDPAIKRLKDEIKTVHGQIFSYLKMAFSGKSKVVRAEAISSIKTLLAERSRLRREIRALKIKNKPAPSEENVISHFWEDVRNVLGWLLSFYVLSYIIAYPFTVKKLVSFSLPAAFYFYDSTITKAVTIFLFIFYGVTTIVTYWLRDKKFLMYLVYPLSLFAFLLIALNLM